MKILAISHIVSGFTQEDLNPYGLEEIKAAWELYAENTFREIYYSKERHAAIIVLECDNEEEAQKIIGTLPMVEKGLIAFDYYQLEPFAFFSILFAKDN